LDTAVTELELAAGADLATVKLAAAGGDLVRTIRAGEGATTKVRALLAVDPPAAVKEAARLHNENEDNVGAKFLYARALIEVGKSAEALEILKPRHGDLDAAEARVLRGRALAAIAKASKDLPRAKDELGRAVELNADNIEAHRELGAILSRMH